MREDAAGLAGRIILKHGPAKVTLGIERTFGGAAKKEIPIKRLGIIVEVFRRMAEETAIANPIGAYQRNLADQSGIEEARFRLQKVRSAFLLGADLHHAPGALHGADDFAAFLHTVRHG